MTVNTPSKSCTICKEVKPLEQFHLRARSHDGRQFKCKACACEQRRVWRETHGQKDEYKRAARERTVRWRKQNPQKERAAKKVWATENPEKVREARKRFGERNPGYNAIKSREYTTANAETIRAYRRENAAVIAERCAARRAQQLRAMPPWADRDAIAAFYREARRLLKETGIGWHVDHIIPLQHPLVCGLHIPANLQLLPAVENIRKSNYFVVE